MPTLLRIDDHIRTIGEVDDRDLALLRRALVEEGSADRDYYIDRATIDLLAARGARRELLQLLLEWREGGARVADEDEPSGPYR